MARDQMTMHHNGVNLIPTDRRLARQRRTRLRRWIGAGVAWAGLVVAACVGAQCTWGGNFGATASELTRSQQQISELTQKLNAARRQLAEAQISKQTAQALSDQPDWSILFNLLSSTLDDEVMLREIQIEPQGKGQKAEDRTASNTEYTVSLRGFAKSQPAVSQFVLRLQQNGLFDDVKLLRTGREPVANTSAVTFDIACEIRADGGERR
jgi:Tfp pilus assembly protein PilN